MLTGTKNDSQGEVSIVGGRIVEEKPSSIAEGSTAEEKPTEKPGEAVERPKDILANPKIEETATAQALRKAQGRVQGYRYVSRDREDIRISILASPKATCNL